MGWLSPFSLPVFLTWRWGLCHCRRGSFILQRIKSPHSGCVLQGELVAWSVSFPDRASVGWEQHQWALQVSALLEFFRVLLSAEASASSCKWLWDLSNLKLWEREHGGSWRATLMHEEFWNLSVKTTNFFGNNNFESFTLLTANNIASERSGGYHGTALLWSQVATLGSHLITLKAWLSSRFSSPSWDGLHYIEDKSLSFLY